MALCSLDLYSAFTISHPKSDPCPAHEHRAWDETWQKGFRSMPDERQHPPSGYTAQHFTAILHGYANGLDRLNKAMARERITLHRTTSLQNCGKGRFKTIKRFFGKLAPPISLRHIYCKKNLKQYPNQLTTSLAGIQAVTRFASQACAQLFQERQPSLSITQDWWTLDSPSLSLHIKNSAFPPPAGTPVND